MTISQTGCGLNGAVKLWKGPEQTGAITPPDPEADCIAGEAAEPADQDECAQLQRAGMRSVARKQGEQQAVRGRVGEHDAVGRIAVLANEIEERREISRKQQWAPPVLTILRRTSQHIHLVSVMGSNAGIARICRCVSL